MCLFIGETIDGFFQAMGWSSCVRANALIQKEKNREKSATILGCSYQIGNSVAWLISALAVGQWGWRAGFFVASGFLLIRGLLLLATKPKIEINPTKKVKQQIKNTLSYPIIVNGIALGLLNMIRYGVITWIPLYLFQKGNLTIEQMGKVGFKVCLIPIAGVLGTLLYNKLKIKKDIISIVSLSLLALTFIAIPFTSGIVPLTMIILGSAFLYGSHVFLVSTFPTRFLKQKVVGASTGFIDGMGYVGTVLIGIIIPIIIKLSKGSWNNVFWFWGVLSIATASCIGSVYKYCQSK